MSRTGGAFHDLVSGRRRGLGASLARGLLATIAGPYGAVVRWRNARFDRGRSVETVTVPVVSVGNLTLGGTGKTPFVEWLARWFQARQVRVAILSRGYGGRAGQANDEALELGERLPEVPVVIDRWRVAGARRAIAEHGAQLLLLDDGFQHRFLARDLDLVLLDALEPFGYGQVFPRGALREPLRGLSRASAVALSRADLVDAVTRERIAAQVRQWAPHAPWLEVRHGPRGWRDARGRRLPLEELAGRRVAAFCGLGSPLGFRSSLAQSQVVVAAWREFADHYAYTLADAAALDAWAGGVDAVVCTHKDLVKLRRDQIGGKQLLALEIGIEFLSGLGALEEQLEPLAARAAAGNPGSASTCSREGGSVK